MNYGLMISCRVEEILQEHSRNENWTQVDEAGLYEQALKQVLAERTEAWADGNIRIGDYILLSKFSVPRSTLTIADFYSPS